MTYSRALIAIIVVLLAALLFTGYALFNDDQELAEPDPELAVPNFINDNQQEEMDEQQPEEETEPEQIPDYQSQPEVDIDEPPKQLMEDIEQQVSNMEEVDNADVIIYDSSALIGIRVFDEDELPEDYINQLRQDIQMKISREFQGIQEVLVTLDSELVVELIRIRERLAEDEFTDHRENIMELRTKMREEQQQFN